MSIRKRNCFVLFTIGGEVVKSGSVRQIGMRMEEMEKTPVSGSPAAGRSGRPPRELAGEVEERILDAACKVFLSRGFEGASIDEIAETARSGKPTIYARFPNKQALFAAAVARQL